MCLLVFSINPESKADEFYLILVNVRDEIYDRPTQLASFWKEHPYIIGGMDLEKTKKGGTWFAMSKFGKVSALLNILQPESEVLPDKKGRGFLVVDYLLENKDTLSFLKDVSNNKDDYNGFLLVTLDFRLFQNPSLAYFTNLKSTSPVILEPGVYSFGNSQYLDEPWQKSVEVKKKFIEILNLHKNVSCKENLVNNLFKLLQDSTTYEIDENMKIQGKGKPDSFLKKLTSVFVEIPDFNYGSRCHTVVLIDGKGLVNYYERSRKENISTSSKEPWIESQFSFQLENVLN